jgi:hypothetical protein
MVRPWHRNEDGLDSLARTWCTKRPARRYFRRAASKARRVGLRRDQRRQEEQ